MKAIETAHNPGLQYTGIAATEPDLQWLHTAKEKHKKETTYIEKGSAALLHGLLASTIGIGAIVSQQWILDVICHGQYPAMVVALAFFF